MHCCIGLMIPKRYNHFMYVSFMLEAIFELGDKFGHFLTLFALSRCQFGTPCRFLFICGMVFALIRRILIVQSENYATNKGKTTWGAKVTQTWGVIGCSKPNFSFIYSINLSIACNELMLKQEWENENKMKTSI